MNKSFLTLLFSAALALSACHNKHSFTLEGTLDNGANRTIYIEELTPDGPQFLDSIHLDANGHFVYNQELPYPTFYNLHSSASDYVVLLPEEGETVSISGDIRQLQWSYDVQGSHGSQLLWQIQDYSNHGINRLLEIIEMDRKNKEQFGEGTPQYQKAKEATDSIFRDAMQEQVDYVSHFIQDNAGSLATLIALYKTFNNRPIIAPEVNFDYYQLVLDSLKSYLPDNPHTIHFETEVAHLKHRYGQPKQALDMVFDGQDERDEE